MADAPGIDPEQELPPADVGIRPPVESLSRASVRGGVAFIFARGGVDAVRLLSILLLARLLSPSDFGVVAMVLAVIGISDVLQDFGLSMASVQRPTITDQQSSTLMWINVAIATVLSAAVFFGAPLVADLVKVPDVVGLTRVLALSFMVSALSSQPMAMLERGLRFGTLARIRMVKALVYAGATVGLAAAGFGRGSLVWGLLLSLAIESAMALTASPLRVMRPKADDEIVAIARLGGGLLGFSLLTYVAGAVPLLAIGRAHGPTETGLYGRAQRLVGLSTAYLVTPVTKVAFPVLSRIADQPERFARYYYEAQAMLAIPVLCMAPFIVVNASALVDVLLGSQWSDAAPVMVALAVALVTTLPCTPTGWVMVSLGRGDRLLKWGAIGWPVALVGSLIGARQGAAGAAVGYAAASAVMVWPCLVWAFKDTSLLPARALRECLGPVPAALAAVVGSMLIGTAVEPFDAFPGLVVTGMAHVVIFAAVLMMSARQRSLVRTVTDRLRPSAKVATA